MTLADRILLRLLEAEAPHTRIQQKEDFEMDPVNDGKVRVSTIRFTPGDQDVIDRIKELKGTDNLSDIVRFALRRLRWELESMARGGTPDNRPTIPIAKVAPQSDNRPFSVSRK